MSVNFRYDIPIMPAMRAVTSVIQLALLALVILIYWRLFTKAGLKGWKSLIPIYNEYCLYDIGWEGRYFWYILLCAVLPLSVLLVAGYPRLVTGDLSGIAFPFLVIDLVASLFVMVISCKMSIRLSHRFNRSTAFGVVGLWLFSIVGFAILAFGSADYDRARDTGDGVWRPDAVSGANKSASED